MSSCACFQHFGRMACLDNLASGIPNAIIGLAFGGWNNAAARVNDPVATTLGTAIESARAIGFGARPGCRLRKLRSRRKLMSNSKNAVRKILDLVKADKRTSRTEPE